MEQSSQRKSIWGKHWESFRKWFYPAWLIYETTTRFYDYAFSVHTYFENERAYFSSSIGEIGTFSLDIFCTIGTFVICSAFLTIPTAFLLYKFFKIENLTDTRFEGKMKRFL